ncbi:hypothetical protein T12_12577 [Trichinella patagoniensis]|uniref:Uncharacterized protein n=1 Tax=Trichinella patagoniensis TaxID=990121 RepID=A0A0V1ADT9_9BILA|nr:hypothetical protein T12_12577 [Trichinella patagoniensis]
MDPIYTMAFILLAIIFNRALPIVSETLDELYFLSDLFCQLAQLICVECDSAFLLFVLYLGTGAVSSVRVRFFSFTYVAIGSVVKRSLSSLWHMTNEKRKSENADDTKQNNKRQKVYVVLRGFQFCKFGLGILQNCEHIS